jgi:hypothetical protein
VANLIRGQCADIFSLEEDLPLIPLELARNEVEQGGLASAVRADDGHNLPAAHYQIGAIDRLEVVKGLYDLLHTEHRSILSFRRLLSP